MNVPAPEQDPLDGIDTIDWSAIQHAYGAATDVPNLLRDVAGADEPARGRAQVELGSNIHHQGNVYGSPGDVGEASGR